MYFNVYISTFYNTIIYCKNALKSTFPANTRNIHLLQIPVQVLSLRLKEP
nr:MAG TPA: hypothetical protein [Caudoviricetes sp.]